MAGDVKRIALVIGNSAYEHALPLRNPRNDAAGIGGKLAELGFEVISGLDLGRDAMEDKLIEFETAIGGASAAMLFYAGHGLQVKGHNYLVPVDAKIEQEIQLKRRAFSLDELLEIMVRRARATLIFLDACRDNPFSRSLLSGMSIEEQKRYLVRSGLAEVKASQGSFIAFATAPDNTASDGKGANSPFTEALLSHIETPDDSVSDMMIKVRNDVLRVTNGRQEPWDQSSLRERFCFKALAMTEEFSPPDPEPTVAPAPIDSRTVEYAYWMEIKDGSSPGLFEEFLQKFSDGVYAPLARRKLETLRAEIARREREAHERAEAEARAKAEAEAKRQREAEAHAKAEADASRRREEAARRKAERGEPAVLWRTAGSVAAGVLVLAVGAYVLWSQGSVTPEPSPTPDSPQAESTATKQPARPTHDEAAAHPGKVPVTVRMSRGRDKEQWLKPGDGKRESFQDCIDSGCTIKGPEMVVVPAGHFTMGSPDNEPERDNREGPQHKVTIGASFAVGKYAVTFDEWDACVADGGCGGYRPDDRGWGRGDQPAININWDDARSYVSWLKKKSGKKYRLLTEAEWEYAARSGTETPFWWGKAITPNNANYNGSYVYRGGGHKGEYRQKTLTVKSFQPTPWGLYQMHGNVLEWVGDCWHDNYNGAPDDGAAWLNGKCASRVLRGGSFNYSARGVRAAYRRSVGHDRRVDDIGFRVARTL